MYSFFCSAKLLFFSDFLKNYSDFLLARRTMGTIMIIKPIRMGKTLLNTLQCITLSSCQPK